LIIVSVEQSKAVMRRGRMVFQVIAPADFKSAASANSATPAYKKIFYPLGSQVSTSSEYRDDGMIDMCGRRSSGDIRIPLEEGRYRY
jgi:hypothetical protein